MPKPEFRSQKNIIDSMIRVNHAGEYGAVRIYQGQLDATRDTDLTETIQHMYDQEVVHFEYFNNLIIERKIRPTIMLPYWRIMSYVLGFVTSKCSAKTAMLCTEAVENVIDKHYEEQIHVLESIPSESKLLQSIRQYRAEELEHRDIATEYNDFSFASTAISVIIGAICRTAIALSQ